MTIDEWNEHFREMEGQLPAFREIERQVRALAISRRRKLMPFMCDTDKDTAKELTTFDAVVMCSQHVLRQFTCHSELESYVLAVRKTFKIRARDNGLIWC